MENQNLTKNPKPKKSKTWIFIVVPFIIIATCNYIVNTQDEKNVIKNPQPGDFFVFRGLVSERDQAFKVRNVEKDSIEFFVPGYEMWEFKLKESESKIREMDKNNELYKSGITIKLAKLTIDSLVTNSELGSRVSKHPKTFFIAAFK
jgi:hypothetical protein